MSSTVEMVRRMFKQNDDVRDAGLDTPNDIVRYDDIAYGVDSKWQTLDVYRSRSAENKLLPVIVSVHGGGWVYGDKERYQFYCMSLAQRGFAVVNFSYRLSPEYKFPAHLEDTNTVFTWVLRNGDMYGFDTKHIFAVGDSAGANILGLYASVCTNPAYAARYNFQPPAGFVPTAIALNCGVYQIDAASNSSVAPLLQDFLPQKGTDEELDCISVVNHITPGFPPTFFMTCSEDFLKDQAPILAAKLEAEKVPSVSRYYGDAANPLPHVFHCNIRLEAARLCNDETCAFFRGFL